MFKVCSVILIRFCMIYAYMSFSDNPRDPQGLLASPLFDLKMADDIPQIFRDSLTL